MITRFRKNSVAYVILAIALTFLVGCSSTVKPAKTGDPQNNNGSRNISNVSPTPAADKSSADNASTSPAPENDSSSQDDSQKSLLTNIMELAQQGKIINSQFPVKTTVIDTVEEKLGKPDKVDWVPSAKGNYAVFSKYNVVFGFNKGSQIFEARSYDNRLDKISLSVVKKVYGTPAYDVKSNGQEIIGYIAGPEYKILLVFPQPTNVSKDPLMDHYSVLYPKGTVNIMADDPGRQW